MKISPEKIAPILSFLVKLWSKTLNYSRMSYKPVQATRKKQSVVFALWHNELFPLCYLHRNEGVIAVVSASQDGELLAQVLKRFGFNLARGSSSRQGLRALLMAAKMMNTLKKDVVFTVDGPRGPRHKVKKGAIFLAARNKVPIVPVRVKMSRAYVFNRAWDKFQLPLPWSSCEVIYGKPYLIPENFDPEFLEQEALRLENKLKNLVSD